jgi:S-adenosylmethionine:tRNA ribosyltransferase-isomerase
MKVSDFDFQMPERLIALEPVPQRDSSRLMVLNESNETAHRQFHDIVEYLNPGDMLLLNNTKVLPYRLQGRKPSGGLVEITLVRDVSEDGSGKQWEVLSKGGYTGPLEFTVPLWIQLTDGVFAELEYEGALEDILEACGVMPLPPYIKRKADQRDRKWYQTVYAEKAGSIAAPTAGLHFTNNVLEALRLKGVLVRFLTLHVGVGTFLPIRVDEVSEHQMREELFDIPRELVLEINSLEGRLVTVGTTATRAIESYFQDKYTLLSQDETSVRGTTELFIHPGYEFTVVQGLLTNFHLPRSTPLMLASAFCGKERLLAAYHEAIEKEYRFFSYGDAMLLLKGI